MALVADRFKSSRIKGPRALRYSGHGQDHPRTSREIPVAICIKNPSSLGRCGRRSPSCRQRAANHRKRRPWQRYIRFPNQNPMTTKPTRAGWPLPACHDARDSARPGTAAEDGRLSRWPPDRPGDPDHGKPECVLRRFAGRCNG
jgi:hypothetical protein